MNKKGELKMWQWALIAFVAVLIISPGARTAVFGVFGQDDGIAPGAQDVSAQRCYIEDTTLTLGAAQEMWNPSTKATTQYHRLYKNGVDKGLLLDGSTITANPGDKVAIYWAENGSSTSYYAAKQEFTIPCAGEVTAGEMPDSNAYKLYAIGNMNASIKVFNEDNGNLNSATDNESLAAGDSIVLDVRMDGVFEDAFSPYGNMILVVDANDTDYKDFAAGSFPSADVPNQHKADSVDNKQWAFELPNCLSNCDIDFGLAVEVESGVNPGQGDGESITLTFYDEDWFQNTDTGEMEFGVEDNDDADVGGANKQNTINVD